MLRQGVDIISIILVLILSFSFNVPLSIREGTIIGMLTFSPIMEIFMKVLRPIFIRLDLTDYK